MHQPFKVPLAKVQVKRRQGRLVLFIEGQRKEGVSQRILALLECFLSHKGEIVPYELLPSVMESRSPYGPRFLHNLRQSIRELKILFREERIDDYFAVAEFVGYGLFEVAEW